MAMVRNWVRKLLCTMENLLKVIKWDIGCWVHVLVPFLIAMGKSRSLLFLGWIKLIGKTNSLHIDLDDWACIQLETDFFLVV